VDCARRRPRRLTTVFVRFLFPNVLFEPVQKFKAGLPGDYSVGEVDERWKDKFGVWMVRNEEMMYALITTCTHLGCTPNWLPSQNKFKCPATRGAWAGLSFFLFLVETFTGLLLMFYYRPTLEYAYTDIVGLREHVPLGIMREMHRWGAHAMVITVWLHMFRVFMTGSYKPPREFNWSSASSCSCSRCCCRSRATCCRGTSWRSGRSRSARTWRARRRQPEQPGGLRRAGTARSVGCHRLNARSLHGTWSGRKQTQRAGPARRRPPVASVVPACDRRTQR
jgi:hypothetical protein